MKRILEKLYFARIFLHFKFVGSRQEVADLKSFIRLLATVPTGQIILENVLKDRKRIRLFFDKNMDERTSGLFNSRTYNLKLNPRDLHNPDLSEEEQFKRKAFMTEVLSHELQHAATAVSIRKSVLGARSTKDFILASRIIEASAYYMQRRVQRELLEQYPQIGEVYVYHDPKDPPGVERSCVSKDDPNFIQYHGKVLVAVPKQEVDVTQFFLDAYEGKNSRVNGSVNPDQYSDDRAMKRPTQDLWRGIEEILWQTGVQIPRHELLKQAWRSTVYPSKKGGRK